MATERLVPTTRRKTRAPKARRKTKVILAFSTVGDESAARRIAEALVEDRLVACVNVIGPIHSTYRWRGALATESEHLMLIKTQAALYTALERRLKELHPYEVPELVAVELSAIAEPYLEWLTESTAGASEIALAAAKPRPPRGQRGAT